MREEWKSVLENLNAPLYGDQVGCTAVQRQVVASRTEHSQIEDDASLVGARFQQITDDEHNGHTAEEIVSEHHEGAEHRHCLRTHGSVARTVETSSVPDESHEMRVVKTLHPNE